MKLEKEAQNKWKGESSTNKSRNQCNITQIIEKANKARI